MTNTNLSVYRVQGYYASGRFVSRFVGATDVINARDSVINADNRIVRITQILKLPASSHSTLSHDPQA